MSNVKKIFSYKNKSKFYHFFLIFKLLLASYLIIHPTYHEFIPEKNRFKSYGFDNAREYIWPVMERKILLSKGKTDIEIREEINSTYIKHLNYLTPAVYSILTKNVTFYIEYAVIVTFVDYTSEVLKLKISRERPDKSNKKSFPSGHAALTTLGTIGMLHLVNPTYGMFFVLPLTYVCMSRVFCKRHHMTDILGGMLLSIFWFASIRYISRKYLVKLYFKNF